MANRAFFAAVIFLIAASFPATSRSISPTTGLVSPPLEGGAGGVVCSCNNVTNEAFQVNFLIWPEAGSGLGCLSTLEPTNHRPGSCILATTDSATCFIRRLDRPASRKHMKCTFSSVDAAGNPTTVVPVETKVK